QRGRAGGAACAEDGGRGGGDGVTAEAIRRAPDGTDGIYPLYDSPAYRSTSLRAPREPLVILPERFADVAHPVYGEGAIAETDSNLTLQHEGEPLGERIIVTGCVVGSDGRPVRGTLSEIWQANAAGRYRHAGDQHPAP